jgi:hypothetical protein
MEPDPGRERGECAFHRIAVDGPRAAGPVYLRVVAEKAGAHERQERGPPRVAVYLGGQRKLAVGTVARTAGAHLAVRDHDALRRHLVASERARLVGADHRRGAQGLDGGQPADDRVARRHAPDADGERDGDDRRQPFRDDADGKGDDGDEGVRPVVVARQHSEAEQQDGAGQDHPGEPPAEVVDLAQQRRGELLYLAEQRADAADLGRNAGRDGNAGALARRDHRAGEGHAAAVAERGVHRHCALALLRRNRLAGQEGLVDQQAARPDEPEVGGNAVAGLDQHDVPGHDLGRRDADPASVPHDVGARGDHAADGGERVLGLALLHKADDRVYHYHGDDDDGVDVVAECPCNDGAGKEDVDQRVVELRQEAQEGVRYPRRGKLVAPVTPQALGGLACRQAAALRHQLSKRPLRIARVKWFSFRLREPPIKIIHPAGGSFPDRSMAS